MPKIYGVDTSTTSVGGGISAFYRYSSNTTIADPGDGKYRFNNATPASVTTIAISKIDSDGFSRTGIGLLRDGDAILFSATHHSISQAYELTASPIDNTTWYSLSVTNKLTNGSFSDNDHTEVTAIFSGASKYTELSDVPQSFTGDAGKLVAVNGTESGLEHRVLTSTDIPNLDASKITTGVFDPSEIPDLSANKITTDTIATARLGSGTANNTTFLRGDQTWQTINTGGVVSLTNDPTSTTNPVENALVYATATDKLWFCKDNEPNFNIWREIQWGDEYAGWVERSYPGGTLANDVGANTAPNKVIADEDILWYIGTNRLTTGYTNPVDGTRITRTNSGVFSGYGTPAVLADRAHSSVTGNNYLSSNVSQSWFRFDFGANTQITLNKVAIQQRGDAASSLFRTVIISYSNNGSTFTNSVSTTASNGQGDWHIFDVVGFPFSQHIEFRHTSTSSSGDNYFAASEVLLYGRILLI